MRLAVILLFAILILNIVIVHATNISSCTEIKSSGEYALNGNIPAALGACITVQASGVSLDCKGHEISGQGTGYGITINASDAKIENCSLSNNAKGLYIISAPNGVVKNTHFYGNWQDIAVENKGSSAYTLNLSGMVLDNPYGDYRAYTNISALDIVSPGSSYAMKWSENPSFYPQNRVSFANKFMVIEVISGNASIEAVDWHWNDAEVVAAGYNESLFELWQLGSADSWENLKNETKRNEKKRADKILVSGENSFSVFGIFQRLEPKVPSKPQKELGRTMKIEYSVLCPGTLEVTIVSNTTRTSDVFVRVSQVRPYTGELAGRVADSDGKAQFLLPGYADYIIEATRPEYAKTITTMSLNRDKCATQPEPSKDEPVNYAALRVINSIAFEVDEAEKRGSVTEEARIGLAYAIDAYSNEEYPEAVKLAYEAKKSIPPRDEYFYILGAITLMVFIELYLHIKGNPKGKDANKTKVTLKKAKIVAVKKTAKKPLPKGKKTRKAKRK